MDEISETNETIYTFRFGTSKKIIQLTQQQLNHFPYLAALVNHTDNFLCKRNGNGEYVLNHPFRLNLFMAIFLSITREQPFALFTELAQEANVLNMLQLYDYICIDPLPLPLLKKQKLALTNPTSTDDKNISINYRRANVSEARCTAIQFIIGISKNAYNLNDLETINSIFSLIMVIFSNPNIFHTRFRHHTLTIVKKYCYLLFSDIQQSQLPTTQQIIQNIKIDFFRYLDNDNQSLPVNFDNAFTWKGSDASRDKDDIDLKSTHRGRRFETKVDAGGFTWWDLTLLRNSQAEEYLTPIDTFEFDEYVYSYSSLLGDYFEKEHRKNDPPSARSGRFNILPKRPTVDKFKHRCGAKVQKYR